MKHIILLTGIAIGCAGALQAAEVPTFQDFDTNKDGKLDPQEYEIANQDLEGRPDADSQVRRTALLLSAPDDDGNRSVKALEEDANLGGFACDPEQRFFVRDAIQGKPLAICSPSGSGFSFSAEDDRETGITSLKLDGGLGLRLMQPKRYEKAMLGLFAFIEGHDLKYTSEENNDEGQLRAGFQVEIDSTVRTGETGIYFRYTAAPYALTDANFDAEGFGITASVVPTIPDWRLNSRLVTQQYWFSTDLTFDYVDVRKGGVSGLEDGTEYLWAEATLGGHYLEPGDKEKNRNGYKLGLVGTYARDLINDEDYSHLSASWNVFLDSDKSTSLKFEYKRGETRQSPKFQDVASIGLTVQF